jgi:succinate dehydrogenase / fumarate reductase cytochrome b subunit
MNRLSRFFGSTIGAKVGMAVTGILLAGFVIAHLLGNLLVFRGRDAMNDYAAMLKGLGAGLWVARLGLLGVFGAHIALAIGLKRRNAAARPIAYGKPHTIQASLASRTMVYSGLLVLAFVLMHLAHFTLGWLQPGYFAMKESVVVDGLTTQRHDVYAMLILGFRSPIYVLLYSACMVVLGLHLSHGLHSLFQSLGLRHPAYLRAVQTAGTALAWILAIGFLSIPFAVLTGAIGKEVVAP